MNVDQNGKATLLSDDKRHMKATASILRTLAALATLENDHSHAEILRNTSVQVETAIVDYSAKETPSDKKAIDGPLRAEVFGDTAR